MDLGGCAEVLTPLPAHFFDPRLSWCQSTTQQRKLRPAPDGGDRSSTAGRVPCSDGSRGAGTFTSDVPGLRCLHTGT